MEPIISDELKNNWLKKENVELEQRRRRRYLHFDEVLEKISPSTFRKITNPKFIEKYGFFPLIQKIQKIRLYKRDPITKRKHIKAKLRPISYAAHFDALIYSWYGRQLEEPYEKNIEKAGLSTNVIAYRKLGKSNLSFAKEVFEFINSQEKCVAIALDIKGFYDTLDFKHLKKSWASVLKMANLPIDHYKVYKSVTRFSYVDIKDIKELLNIGRKEYQKLKFFLNINILDTLRINDKIKTNKDVGIPQGTPISCILSNIYMFDFDTSVANEVNKLGGLYRRYSDDIIVVCPQDKVTHIKKYLMKEITNISLVIEDSKTETKLFTREDGALTCTEVDGKLSELQYLGVKFNGKKMTLRHKGYAKFERKMTKSIRGEVLRAEELKVSIAKRKIYEKFTPLGKTNYVAYAKRAIKELESGSIKKPISAERLFRKIKGKITKTKHEIEQKKKS